MANVLTRIEKVLTVFSIVSVFLIVWLTTIDSVGRYLFNRPLQGAYEMTEKYLMVVSVFFALSYGYRYGSNIRVTFLVRHLPRRTKLAVDYIVQILSILYGSLLVVGTFIKALKSINEKMMDAYDLPLGPAYLVMPVGLLMLTLWMIYDLRQVRQGKSRLLVEEEDPATTTVT
jgi:TRAP-type transport system small permease protein